jgi:hypothetical protein
LLLHFLRSLAKDNFEPIPSMDYKSEYSCHHCGHKYSTKQFDQHGLDFCKLSCVNAYHKKVLDLKKAQDKAEKPQPFRFVNLGGGGAPAH